jgi:K+-transporting ATPase ATPase B chain
VEARASPARAVHQARGTGFRAVPVLRRRNTGGVRDGCHRHDGHDLLRRNLLIWGLGGVLVPFAGIKLIDVAMVALNLAA